MTARKSHLAICRRRSARLKILTEATRSACSSSEPRAVATLPRNAPKCFYDIFVQVASSGRTDRRRMVKRSSTVRQEIPVEDPPPVSTDPATHPRVPLSRTAPAHRHCAEPLASRPDCGAPWASSAPGTMRSIGTPALGHDQHGIGSKRSTRSSNRSHRRLTLPLSHPPASADPYSTRT